jgi:dipeptidyl aminopeptidase/acylaminoacyl peptidase
MFATRSARIVTLALLLAPALTAQSPGVSEAPKYLLPPKPVIDTFDATPLPQIIVSPNRQLIAFEYRKGNPTIAELARPMLRLAGARVDPKTNGPHRTAGVYAIALKKIGDASEVKVTVPPQANLSNLHFSPNGAHLSFLATKENAIELWVADTATGNAKLISGTERLNGAGNQGPGDQQAGDPCEWLRDSTTIVCRTVPAGRGPAPAEPTVPTGPTIQENYGKAAPAPTFEDLLRTAHDDALFEYYFASQLAAFDIATGRKTPIGRPALIGSVAASPNGDYLLVTRITRPFSHILPMGDFPENIEVWTRSGEVLRKLADVPSREGIPTSGVQPGPRAYRWRPDQPATVIWTEALDGGNPRNKAPFRDKVVSLTAPFTGQPTELVRTEFRLESVAFTEKGIGLVTEADRVTRRTRTWLLEPGTEPRKLWDRKQDAAYDNPGSPVTRGGGDNSATGGGRGGGRLNRPIVQNGDSIYVEGLGASPEGDRPFLDRVNLKTLTTERLFRSDAKAYESVVAPLGDDAKTILTRYETPREAPNYYVRDLASSARRPLTTFKDPQPLIRGAEHQYVTYQRKDGVKLSATLYLPPGYKKGERLPVIMWAYPREFGDADSASQVSGSPNRFTILTNASHLYLLLSGYAVFDNPTMPIIGPGETANDTYVEQLVASAEAAIDKVVEMGVGDRDRIGVGGHSYGAFMTANLLAHSRLFRAGFAESGAYNRTLTPFQFQSERRTFWEVPQLYGKMSPFWHADQVKDPILLTHGEEDDNSGTFPIQSERFFMALKGLGATVRYVTLPYEAHGYAARETLLHVLAERVAWFDKYVKNAQPRATTDAARDLRD